MSSAMETVCKKCQMVQILFSWNNKKNSSMLSAGNVTQSAKKEEDVAFVSGKLSKI